MHQTEQQERTRTLLQKSGFLRLQTSWKSLFAKELDPAYFIGKDKIYLASADQFKGMEPVLETDNVLQCRHFYSVIGGLAGLNILSRLKRLQSITLFDFNPFMLDVCRMMISLIRHAEYRDTFISLIYLRRFDSNRFGFHNQSDFYALPIDPAWQDRLSSALGSKLLELFKDTYLSYIQNPMVDIYDGASIHCTRMPIFHEAPINGVMTHPFMDRGVAKCKKTSSINSFFFGKGWLASEERYQQVRRHLLGVPIAIEQRSILELEPHQNSGLYATNAYDGREKNFRTQCEKFMWTLWYSRRSKYLQLEYAFPEKRLIPFSGAFGKGVRNPHASCCLLLDSQFELNTQPFLEIIQPHVTEGMNYGFRFYRGQRPISVNDFLSRKTLPDSLPLIIGIHILLGGGCRVEVWKDVVRKAMTLNRTLFIFEHRKECTDWPESDVDPSNLLPEKDIDKFLLSLDGRWTKFGAANRRGKIKDIRNICWILRGDSSQKELFS